MYGSAKEYAAENATLKKMWNGPDSIIFAWWNDRYKVSLLINKTFEGLRGIPDSNELCILWY